MSLVLVVAITRSDALEAVESKLHAVGVRAITVTRVRGWGEYANLISEDHKVDRLKAEVFVDAHKARQVTDALLETCHDDCLGDGVVAVLPVQEFLSARTGRDAIAEMAEACGAQRPGAD
jgi:nitrogen regulatory protein P-II 1